MKRILQTTMVLALAITGAACKDDPVAPEADMGTASDMGSGDSSVPNDMGVVEDGSVADDSSVSGDSSVELDASIDDAGPVDAGPPDTCIEICTFQNTCGAEDGGTSGGPDCEALCGAFDALRTPADCGEEYDALISCYVENPGCTSTIDDDAGVATCDDTALGPVVSCYSDYCGMSEHSEEAACVALVEAFGGGGGT